MALFVVHGNNGKTRKKIITQYVILKQISKREKNRMEMKYNCVNSDLLKKKKREQIVEWRERRI